MNGGDKADDWRQVAKVGATQDVGLLRLQHGGDEAVEVSCEDGSRVDVDGVFVGDVDVNVPTKLLHLLPTGDRQRPTEDDDAHR